MAKENKCYCDGPYTCKIHMGEGTFCTNLVCLCHGSEPNEIDPEITERDGNIVRKYTEFVIDHKDKRITILKPTTRERMYDFVQLDLVHTGEDQWLTKKGKYLTSTYGFTFAEEGRFIDEDSTPTDKSGWPERLEKLALTEPDPNQALYNLPMLKGFISEEKSLSDTQGYERGLAEGSRGDYGRKMHTRGFEEGRIAGLKEALEGLPEEVVVPEVVEMRNPGNIRSELSDLISHGNKMGRNETIAQVRDTINRKLQK